MHGFDSLHALFGAAHQRVNAPIATPPATATAGGIHACVERADLHPREQGDPARCAAPSERAGRSPISTRET